MDKTEPFVAPDLDLRDFRWMKLDIVALLNSDFNATPDDTAWRAGVTLWARAWHQVPAGSLPNDDGKLCSLAGLGRDLRTWRRIRGQALHGFAVCSDGRLYHRFLCQMATEAAAERERFSRRKAADRARKSAARSAGVPSDNSSFPSEIHADNSVFPAEIHMENLLEGQGEGEGQGDSKGERSDPNRILSKPEPSESVAAREEQQTKKDDDVLNPVVRLTPPPQAPNKESVKRNIKSQLRQKLLRFCNARMSGRELMDATMGLLGEDPNHNEQWWFDELDRKRKREGWDDTREWKREHLSAAN